MPLRARIYIAIVIAARIGIFATAAAGVNLPRTVPILIYLACSAAGGFVKILLPGIGFGLVLLVPVDLPVVLVGRRCCRGGCLERAGDVGHRPATGVPRTFLLHHRRQSRESSCWEQSTVRWSCDVRKHSDFDGDM